MWTWSRSTLSPGPTWVYEMRCGHGALLYVGITADLDLRIAQHRRSKSWWDEVEEITASEFSTRAAARQMELDVILHERPLYNIADVNEQEQYRSDPLAGRRRGLPARALYPKEPVWERA